MAVPLLGPKARFADLNFNPLSGGLLYSYVAGTSTPLPTYTDASGTVPNTNPVVLDSSGYANIWLGSGTYKFILTDSLGVQQWSQDNYPGSLAQGFGGTVLPISANTNITSTYNNSVIIASGTISLNLQPAATAGQGFVFSVYNNGVGVITIDPSGAETINGAATLTLSAGESVLVDCSGTAWFGLFKRITPPVTAKTAAYTVLAGDNYSLIEVNASTATKDLPVTLPSTATVPNGFTVTVKKTDADATLSATLANNSFASTNTSTTVTVTDTAAFIANLTVGDIVTFSSATTFGGIPAVELNRSQTVLSIPTSTTYTFASTTAATSTATGGGAAINRSALINNTVTLNPVGGQTIDGAAAYVLNAQYQSVTIVSNGTNWDVSVAKQYAPERYYTSNVNFLSLVTAIPYDDSPPLITEGTEILSQSFVPASTTATYRVRIGMFVGANTSITATSGLFINAGAQAISAKGGTIPAGGAVSFIGDEYEYAPGSTAVQTISVRVGPQAGGNTVYLNGSNAGAAARIYGGTGRATMIIERVA